MRKLAIIVLFASLLLSDTIPLSNEKIELLKLQRQKIEQDIKKGTKSWISPVSISVSATKSQDASSATSEVKSAGLGWNQDIFRSGGIEYSIKSAKDIGAVNLLGIDINEAAYIKQAYTLKAQIERDRLTYRQQELTLKNSDINLLIIKAKYKAGSADITDLSRSTIDRDNARKNLIATKNILQNELFGLKKLIGNKQIDTIKLPNIQLLSEKEYIKNNLELLKYRAMDQSNNTSLQLTKSSYMPKLTFGASAGYSNYKGNIVGYSGDHYSYGLTLSMPLDINNKATIESARLEYLQSKEAGIDRKLELEQEYQMHMNNIADFKEKISVAEDMMKMYDDLYSFTDKQYKAGFKSAYDLESLKNSLQIQKLEKQIEEYNIIIEKISLYFDTKF
ncbi:MAG: TolC family protein [Sulfurospirillaceae bacterium]|nr:TolC family protein [Sulfurospirillaceae bacterium]